MAESEYEWIGDQLAFALVPYRGQLLIGVVDAWDTVEIVFAERRGAPKGNLLRLWFKENDKTEYAHESVPWPEDYVAKWGFRGDEVRPL